MTEQKERNEKIVDLWNTGMTATQVGIRLRISRNTVMGVIHRFRKKGENVQKRVVEKPAIKTPKAGGPLMMRKVLNKIKAKKKAIKPIEQIEMPFLDIEPVSSKNCTIMELTLYTCRYVVSDVNGVATIYCGERVDGGSYCKSHKKLCYHYANSSTAKPAHPARYA